MRTLLRVFKYTSASLAFAALTAQATQVLSFNIVGNIPWSDQNRVFMLPGDLAGAARRVGNWNNLTNNLTYTDSMLTNSAGQLMTGSNITVAVVLGGNGSGPSNRGQGAGTNINIGALGTATNENLLCLGVLDEYWGGSTSQTNLAEFGSVNIANIPFARYDAYFYYFVGDNPGAAVFRAGVFTNVSTGEQRWVVDTNGMARPGTDGTGYVECFQPAKPADASLIPAGNYVTFLSQSNRSLDVYFAAVRNTPGDQLTLPLASNPARLKFCGFQIVEISPYPPTNLVIVPTPIPNLLAGNPSAYPVRVYTVFPDGTSNNVTAASTFSSGNANVFTVDAAGALHPGSNGIASLVASYQALSATNLVTVVGPTAVRLSLSNTNLLVGNGVGDTAQAALFADFPGSSNVNVTSFGLVFFGGTTRIVACSTNGLVTALAPGRFGLTGAYDGLAATMPLPAGSVTFFNPPGFFPAFSVNITDTADKMSFHDLSGAPGVRAGYWNNLPFAAGAVNVTSNLNSLVDCRGNPLPGVLVQVTPNSASSGVYGTPIATGTRTANESVMFNTYYDQGWYGFSFPPTPNSFIIVSNVPFAGYDAYFYFFNDPMGLSRPAFVTINGVTQWRQNDTSAGAATVPDNNGNGYLQAITTVPSPLLMADIPIGNFIKFSNLTNALLSVAWGAAGMDLIEDASFTPRVRLAGFQLVEPRLAPPRITASLSARTLHLSWPPNYLGWVLQANPGLDARDAWYSYFESVSATSEDIPVNPATPNLFFRLVQP